MTSMLPFFGIEFPNSTFVSVEAEFPDGFFSRNQFVIADCNAVAWTVAMYNYLAKLAGTCWHSRSWISPKKCKNPKLLLSHDHIVWNRNFDQKMVIPFALFLTEWLSFLYVPIWPLGFSYTKQTAMGYWEGETGIPNISVDNSCTK